MLQPFQATTELLNTVVGWNIARLRAAEQKVFAIWKLQNRTGLVQNMQKNNSYPNYYYFTLSTGLGEGNKDSSIVLRPARYR
jgi:hypothetical protein